MSKQDLIHALNDAIASENASALCARNIVSTFAWSGLPENERRRATEALNAIAAAPERRARRIREILDRLTWSESDVL